MLGFEKFDFALETVRKSEPVGVDELTDIPCELRLNQFCKSRALVFTGDVYPCHTDRLPTNDEYVHRKVDIENIGRNPIVSLLLHLPTNR